ncbi:hypothetical protein LVJ94_42100 [Pendulispora rubella]|uniref:Uncharacterized protein n=1 Tax=Pendulispora rubella TaxID=2741070 RepID=A0ABZ2KXS0_9BACT
MKIPTLSTIDTLTLDEAHAYLDAAHGDELEAAVAIATDRNKLDGTSSSPDDAEVHHAYFLLRRARGMDAPSFDTMRVELKKRMVQAA